MHISDGVLPAWVLVAGWGVLITTLAITAAWSRKKIGNISEKIPLIAVVTAAFFIACLVSLPVPPTSLHLVLSGLVGILLGPLAPICIFIGLLLQALLFHNGGVTVLGVNGAVMGLPAVLAWFVFKALTKKANTAISAGLASAFSIFISTVLLAVIFAAAGIHFGGLAELADIASGIPVLSSVVSALANSAFGRTVVLLLLMNLPLMIIEGIIGAFIVPFIEKVKPEMLELYKQRN
ncbi:MAG: CbiM family transporter [Methanosarcinales archaeon]|jgi:cobalt/nickel transport system permease protein|nr:CbiM family transporter [Methanosarcinales archaeon]